ncbi:MAG: hypothetical protein JO031_13700 [Ktedonobacteraceae bacterium]|nr:hypothetical protein [Ktedonobacteraceae bacterium]
MAEEIVVKNPDLFTSQAQKHRQMADHTLTMLGTYQVHHDNLVDAMTNSCMAEAMAPYIEWWETFRDHLLSHAELHQQMADHLEKAITNYSENETTLTRSFTPEGGK